MVDTAGPASDPVAELRRSQERYRSLVAASALDVWRADAAGNLVSDLPGWRGFTGQPEGSVEGAGWLEGVHPDDRARVDETWRTAVRTGQPYECEYRLVGDGGRRIQARAIPLVEHGRVREWIGVASDVTDQRRAEEERDEESRLLSEIGRTLSSGLDVQRIVQALTDVTTELTGAQFGAFFYTQTDEHGEAFMLYAVSGVAIEHFSKFPAPRNTEIFAPTFAGEAPVRLDDVTADPRYGRNAPYRGMPEGHLPVRSYLAVPVVSLTGTVHGGLFFGHEVPGVFTERHERLVVSVASHAATALDNARLYEAERQARASAEQAARALELLAQASEQLSRSLDVERIADRLTDLLVPAFVDWAAVELEEDGRRRLVLARHDDPAGQVRLEAALHAGVEPDGETATVDMVARNRLVGWLRVGRRATAFTRPEIQLVEELGRRGAVALDNAVLYSRERAAAITLQRSLLPQRPPELDGTAAAVRYSPGAAGTEVGGDWYDVLRQDDGTVVAIVGDVQGRGMPAAAVMGQLRATVRAYALDGHPPVEVLRRVERVVGDEEDTALTTCVLAALEPATGRLVVASAGHLPPLVVRPDGAAAFVDLEPGLPLGVGGGDFTERTLDVEPGTVIVLYSDGLVEGPDQPVDEGMRRVRDVAAEHVARGSSPDDIADALLALTRGAHDDVAVLVLSHSVGGELDVVEEERMLPAEPAAVAHARRIVERLVGDASEARDAATLLASEIVTNAVRHAHSPVRVRVVRRNDRLRVEVHDEAPGRVPTLRDQRDVGDGLAESGRGLFLVAAMADAWGTEVAPVSKCVWFELTLR